MAPIARLLKNRLFLITVFAPTVLAALYYGFIASDVYQSESSFIIRSTERQTTSALGVMLKGVGFARSEEDAYAVQSFIRSRDALKVLDQELRIGQAFASDKVDRINRFSGLDWDDSFEALHLYYQRRVALQMDSASSIVTLTTSAFAGKDAYAMNKRLLELAEDMVNRLNQRSQQDMIRFAQSEVNAAEARAKTAALALARYRNKQGVIDPEKQAAIPLQQIARLQEELITTKTQILQLENLAKANPQLPVLRQRVELLEREIREETLNVAGGGSSLAGKASDYQRLVLEREFADRLLASAMNTLEQARNEAQRKQLYLERIAQPSLPDHALEPRRLRSVLIVLMLGLISWGIATMLAAGIHEHQD